MDDPLGSTLTAAGCAFGVYSDVDPAQGGSVELCLLDASGVEVWTHDMESDGNGLWRVEVAGVGAGQRYGYRVHPPNSLPPGAFYDAAWLLLDPYARAFAPVSPSHPRQLQSLVVAQSDAPPPCERRALVDTVIYETHVKGFTRLHPQVAIDDRGTFRGLVSEPALEHLRALGVTAVELMPVHQFTPESFLLDQGITDYWGYATIGYFAPHGAYSAAAALGGQVAEFKAMVSALHAAGIEVILDVVFNHTGEGGPGDPPLCFRGLANRVYYWLEPANPGKYVDITGTGNTLDTNQARVLDLIIDSLTYWVQEMGVDGFRFDEAGALAREEGGFEGGSSPFAERIAAFVATHEGVKVIAEPWDASQDSYHLGGFPQGWSEWNGRFRDGVPAFWARQFGLRSQSSGDVGGWLTGSRDTFGNDRTPLASINYVASHDGLTAADKVAASADMGAPTIPSVNTEAIGTFVESRRRRLRNLLATVLVSQGVPMLLGGDELGRSQNGNSNAYDVDDPTSWYNWSNSSGKDGLLTFAAFAIELRGNLPALRRPTPLLGGADSAWYALDGTPMNEPEWEDPARRGVAFWIAGQGSEPQDPDVLIILNAANTPAAFPLPADRGTWELRLDTTAPDGRAAPGAHAPGEVLEVAAEGLLVAARTA